MLPPTSAGRVMLGGADAAARVVISPRTGSPAVKRCLPGGVRHETWADHRNDYLGQQITKLHADAFADADFICHVDSEVIMCRSMTPSALMEEGRPRVVYRRVEEMGRHVPGRAEAAEFLGQRVDYDFMQVPPFTYPVGCTRRFGPTASPPPRRREALHRQFVVAALLRVQRARRLCILRHRKGFVWSGLESVGPRRCRWFWSRGGINAALRRELDALIAP
jgi:hypothetical protein